MEQNRNSFTLAGFAETNFLFVFARAHARSDLILVRFCTPALKFH